ncbi:SMI1/KNR4 family protein [Streptomyces sp. NPDC058614]|uniref:SMI1/KNR4 family protein n=1 Tax=Streptomyces sp. NPDC058614 TaxID=3346557 RepID=UPI00364C2EB1
MARFDEVKATFWGDGPHGVQPPLTDEAVQEAELELGVRLPTSFLDLLQGQNGGLVADRWDAFPTDVPTSWSEDHVPLDMMMGIGRHDDQLSLLDSPYLVKEWGLPSPVVLLSGDGHCWIPLDYRVCGRQGEPSVAWFDADWKSELTLAANFEAFMEGLTSAASFATDGLYENPPA